MTKIPKERKPLWVRDHEGFQEAINAKVDQTGMKKEDWLAQVIKHAIEQDNPLFFLDRGTSKRQRGKCKSA